MSVATDHSDRPEPDPYSEYRTRYRRLMTGLASALAHAGSLRPRNRW